MKIRDLMKTDGRIFFKSGWGQIKNDWPCVSFSHGSVGDFLQRNFEVGRDILIYVGTSDPKFTKNPDHRQRLITAVSIDPTRILDTKNFVSPETWKIAVEEFGEKRWASSMQINEVAYFINPKFPSAKKYIPLTYNMFSKLPNRGKVVEVKESEYDVVYNLNIEIIELKRTDQAKDYTESKQIILNLDKKIKTDITRMTDLILNRVNQSGKSVIKNNPQRTASDFLGTFYTILEKWKTQTDKCALCNGILFPNTDNQLLQTSVDRIDSENIAYDKDNIQITHLGCNFAKNQFSTEKFNEWLKIVREEK